MLFTVSERWKSTYPGASAGVLALRNVSNPAQHPKLDAVKQTLESELRDRFADRDALRALPELQAYKEYYKRFKKTYHVQLQLESIVFKGKNIPRDAALVETMFMAELKNRLLTAAHDLDLVQPPIRLDVAQGDEQYVRINGQEQVLKAGDMYIADRVGILSAVIYGPDQRTRITPNTRRAIYTVYAPPGIRAEAVCAHLQDIERYARLVSPDAEIELLEVLEAA